MGNFTLLYKKEGETPLEALGRFREQHKEYKDIKMTYAGRLDPMASGLLLILAGEEVKNKEKYLKLSKEYEFEVLFGFATDTYDVLGKVTASEGGGRREEELKKQIKSNLKNFTGKLLQKYPAYSSKTWEAARRGELKNREEIEVNVKSLKLIKINKISSKLLLINIEKRVKKVKGDFRQKEILKIWKKNLGKNKAKYFLGEFKISCSSGTYVRSIADSLGSKTKIPALAYSIKRTKIGKYSL